MQNHLRYFNSSPEMIRLAVMMYIRCRGYEIRRRIRVVRIFPNRESCLRLVSALTTETHEGWLEASRYLNMGLLRDHKKEQQRQIAEAA